MNSNFYKIQCITNLHMGSGDINYNVIDNEVERDPVNNLPVMFSSGVKGALRDHFRDQGADTKKIKEIFGSDIIRKNGESSLPGKVRFLTACIMFLPFRAARGRYPYYLVTTKGILQQFSTMYQSIMGKEFKDGFQSGLDRIKDNVAYGNKEVEVKLEDYAYNSIQPIPEDIASVIKEFIPDQSRKQVLIIPDQDFGGGNNRVLLPVLARNCLDKQGISINLWYEEVVPHDAIFYLPILSNGTTDGDNALKDFNSFLLSKNNNLVQFGGNATIGYGLTKVSLL